VKIQELQNKPDAYLIQDPLQVTVREAAPVEMKPKYGGDGEEPNQRLRVSDDTGTITAFVTGADQPFHAGDLLEICAVKGQRGVSGASIKISKQNGSRYLALYARGVRVAGVRRPPAPPLDDPEWLAGDVTRQGFHPETQQRTQARPQQQALPMQQQNRAGSSQQGPARRNSIQAVKILVEMTEQAYNGLADSSVTGVSCDALFEAAQKLATSLWISIDKNQLDYVEPPQEKPTPPPALDGTEDLAPDLDWGYPEEVS
jgi:hypothetical protein